MEENSINLPVHTAPSLNERLDAFLLKYDFYHAIFCPDKPNKNWKPRAERICRFCKKKYPETTFKTDAHHIPEFLGNKYLIFQEECDQCNSRFSAFESHLSAYLGFGLTILSQQGKKNKIPKFKANDGLTAQQEEIYGIKAIVMEKGGENLVKMDLKTGKSQIEFTKNSYIPLYAYKALLKIAATSLPEEDIQYYSILLEALISDQYDVQLADIAVVSEYWLPLQVKSPRVFIFKTKVPTENLPTHTCMLYFGNQAYQFVIPAYSKDAYMKREVIMTMLFCPAFFHFEVGEIKIYEKMVRLSSKDKVVGEKGIFHFESDPEILQNLTAYDPVAKKETKQPFDPNSIVKLIIGKRDDELNLPIEPD